MATHGPAASRRTTSHAVPILSKGFDDDHRQRVRQGRGQGSRGGPHEAPARSQGPEGREGEQGYLPAFSEAWGGHAGVLGGPSDARREAGSRMNPGASLIGSEPRRVSPRLVPDHIARRCNMAEKESTAFIAYLVTCVPTGKQYVGITARSLHRRWYEHAIDAKARPGRNPLRRAIAKYGEAQFTVEVVCCARTWEDLCAAEVALIAQRNTRAPNGYNITLGGEGARGCIRTAAHRAAISRAHLGKQRSAITRAKLSAAMSGRSFNVGAANGGAKLTLLDVIEIRRRLAHGARQRHMAILFKVSVTAIWSIAHDLTWKNVA